MVFVASICKMKLISTLFHVILFFFVSIDTIMSHTSNVTDWHALLAIKDQITSDSSHALASWSKHSIHFCNWTGVSCIRHERVLELDLDSLNLEGTLSPHIGNLSFLAYISLRNNSLRSVIPNEIGRLFRLQQLDLSDNSFDGEIPLNITTCSSLEWLDLSENRLVGKIPGELGSLSKLHDLDLHANNLVGSIPSVLGNLSSLAVLAINDNYLSGILPIELGSLKRLEFFLVSGNQLSGTIPNEIGRLFRLQHLDLSYNSFDGEIPLNITTCSSLELLDLSENRLVGKIPGELGSLSKLYDLDLHANNLVGSIPSVLGNLSSLAMLAINENYLSGILPIELGSLKRLAAFDVSGNQLSGTITNSLCNLSSIQIFDVERNNLSGRLPTNFGLLFPKLIDLTADSNDLYGEIPFSLNASGMRVLSLSNNQLKNRVNKNGESSFLVSFSNNTNLRYLNLGGNQLSGSISNEIGKLTQLRKLVLSQNFLRGGIPDDIQQLMKLCEVDLSGNKIAGQIPPTICKMTPLAGVHLQNNLIDGIIPACFEELENIQYLDLSRNQISGVIPKGFSNFIHSSIYINLSHNSLHGSLPSMNENEAYMSSVQYIDTSFNKLSGNIPEYFGMLRYLKLLNLSSNNLEGEVPEKGIFRNGDAVILLHNNKLCGGIPKLHLPACHNQSLKLNEVKKKYSKLFILKVVMPLVITIPSVIASVICFPHWIKKSKKGKPFTTSLGTEHPQVSYQELSEATDEFSAFNLIGVGSFGSVYRGLIGPEEEMVAIKVFNLSKRGASKGFLAECEALRNIRHRNLVRVVTACSSIDFQGRDFKALVFDYMTNGTLEDWLRPRRDYPNPIRSLNFVERLNIAIDIAVALEYLHHHCQTPIVHCDLKPSNVLLDSDLVAHVGDFGLARLLSEVATGYSYHSIGSSWIRGSIGYIPPEYGISGKLSILGDVYSYGILLLEMLTGTSPTHETFKEGLSLRQHAKTAMPNQVIDILDPRCVQVKDQRAPQIKCESQENLKAKIEESAASMIRLALLCSSESPRDRLQMTEVVKEMHAIRDRLMASRMLNVCIEN